MEWDVIVIGGGPAGMMAAGRAASRGARVLLLEKNDSLGKKLLITGGGRCNVTNFQTDNRLFLEYLKESSKFLFSSFSQWNVQDTLDFFHSRSMPTKVEHERRVFPVSDSAKSVYDVLQTYIEQGNVTIWRESPATGFAINDKEITGVRLANKTVVRGASYILATGGNSHPETGSTGDGFRFLSEIGHTVITPKPSLVPIALTDTEVKRLQGIRIEGAKLTLVQHGVRQESRTGSMLFTHFGISGPAVLNISNSVRELLQYGEVVIMVDLLPTLNHKEIDTAIQEIYKGQSNKRVKNISTTLLPSNVLRVISELAGITPDTPCNSVTKEQRKALVHTLKELPLHVSHLLGLDKAIITSGGVTLQEVDFKTMQSKLFSNLYIIGDVLNIDRPSGGYSLQLCWTTGFVAGNCVPIASE